MAKVFIQDLAEQMASTFGYHVADTQLFVRTFFETIVRGLERDKYVRLRGLGTFKMIEVDDRESINVNTGERFMIQGHAKVSFQPDNGLKELINKPFAHFETVVLSDNLSEEDLLEVDRKFESQEELEESEPSGDVEELSLPEIMSKQTTVETQSVAVSSSIEPVIADDASEPVAVESNLTDEPVIPAAEESKKEEEPLNHTEKEPNVVNDSADTDAVLNEKFTPEEPENRENIVQEKPVVGVPVLDGNSVNEASATNVPMIKSQADEIEKVVRRSNTYTYLWSALCVISLLVGYVMGYFNLLTPKVVKQKVVVRDTVFVPKIVHDTIRIEVDLPAVKAELKAENKSINNTTPPTPKSTAITTVLPKNAAYEIVGTKETYTLRNGETLRILAERYYGNRNMATYIIAHNNITDPNLVAVGMIIKIPELKPKNK